MEPQVRRTVVPISQRGNDAFSNLGQLRTLPASHVSETDVAVVIVSWNTRDILRGCLRSVFEQTQNVSFHVFVIDNNSHDGSAEMVRAEFREVTLIANTENRG